LEKEIFLGLFSVRKLMESNKVTSLVKQQKIELAVYPAGDKPVTLFNQHKFPEPYNLYAGEKESLSYLDICNQFIHSSIFAPFTPTGENLVGIYMASDRTKSKKLYYITLIKIVEMLRTVGNDYPSKLELHFNEKKKDFVVKSV